MNHDRIVVVGGGAAGHSCVAAYREAGGEAPVLLVSADDRLPYDRPALTKDYLTGRAGPDALPLVEPAWYGEHDVTVRLGVAATGLDPTARTVVVDGEAVAWSACVVATGSSAASLTVPGGDDPALLTIRHAADTERVLAAVEARPGPVAVIGSGFIGCEAAASLAARGGEVVMVAVEALPQLGRLGPEVGAVLARWLADDGIDTRFDQQVRRLEHADDGSWRVELASGSVAAAHVLVATGARPRLDLAQRAGLVIDGAIAVDGAMRTTAPGVLAAGDVAAAWHPVAGRRLRVEHWGDAVAMGRVAGHQLAGRDDTWSDVPGFWSTIGGRTLKHAAWGDGWDEVRLDAGRDGFTVWYGQGGALVGVLTHDRDDDYDRGRRLLAAGARFAPAR